MSVLHLRSGLSARHPEFYASRASRTRSDSLVAAVIAYSRAARTSADLNQVMLAWLDAAV
jgi:hypothetical protein